MNFQYFDLKKLISLSLKPNKELQMELKGISYILKPIRYLNETFSYMFLLTTISASLFRYLSRMGSSSKIYSVAITLHDYFRRTLPSVPKLSVTHDGLTAETSLTIKNNFAAELADLLPYIS